MSKEENEKNIFIETLTWICGKLQTAGIPYMITGGSAVGFWGHIRTTMDIDIIIQISAKKIDNFLQSISGDAYVDSEDDHKNAFSKKIFKIILHKTAFKIDIIVLDEQNGYEKQKFNNRIKMIFQEQEIYVISPEDLIISKLMWGKSIGGSERQIKDCESIYALNRETINIEYIKKWTNVLRIHDELNKIM
ncbi:MAG: nucleotidyl transferase AbiEii/AbiGii toxin family protein [bacterium]